jgi:hypothetical protein
MSQSARSVVCIVCRAASTGRLRQSALVVLDCIFAESGAIRKAVNSLSLKSDSRDNN